MAVEVLIHVVP